MGGGATTIVNCGFFSNSISCASGGAISFFGNLTITNSTFVGNSIVGGESPSCRGFSGGAIAPIAAYDAYEYSKVAISISGSFFVNNSALAFGGAVFISDVLIIHSSDFTRLISLATPRSLPVL
jgi:hypothetical protein